jgi:hypothetical protein
MRAGTGRRALGALAGAGLLLGAAAPAPASASLSVLARHALVRRSDLGHGWSIQAPAPRRAPKLTCHAFSPRLSGVGAPGTAASPTFERGPEGPFVSQAAYVYPTVAQQRVVWRRVVVSRLSRCVAAALRAGSGGRTKFTVTSSKVLPLRGVAAGALKVSRYRAVGSASSGGQTIPVYLDELVVGQGAVITTIDLTTFADPPGDRLERRLVRLASSRARA